MIKPLFIGLLLLLTPPCHAGETQIELNEAADREAKVADRKLNEVYKKLMSKLEPPDQKRLKKAELAWLEYRDKECDFEYSQYSGGTIAPLIYSKCFARMTNERVKELQDQIDSIR